MPTISGSHSPRASIISQPDTLTDKSLSKEEQLSALKLDVKNVLNSAHQESLFTAKNKSKPQDVVVLQQSLKKTTEFYAERKVKLQDALSVCGNVKQNELLRMKDGKLKSADSGFFKNMFNAKRYAREVAQARVQLGGGYNNITPAYLRAELSKTESKLSNIDQNQKNLSGINEKLESIISLQKDIDAKKAATEEATGVIDEAFSFLDEIGVERNTVTEMADLANKTEKTSAESPEISRDSITSSDEKVIQFQSKESASPAVISKSVNFTIHVDKPEATHQSDWAKIISANKMKVINSVAEEKYKVALKEQQEFGNINNPYNLKVDKVQIEQSVSSLVGGMQEYKFCSNFRTAEIALRVRKEQRAKYILHRANHVDVQDIKVNEMPIINSVDKDIELIREVENEHPIFTNVFWDR